MTCVRAPELLPLSTTPSPNQTTTESATPTTTTTKSPPLTVGTHGTRRFSSSSYAPRTSTNRPPQVHNTISTLNVNVSDGNTTSDPSSRFSSTSSSFLTVERGQFAIELLQGLQRLLERGGHINLAIIVYGVIMTVGILVFGMVLCYLCCTLRKRSRTSRSLHRNSPPAGGSSAPAQVISVPNAIGVPPICETSLNEPLPPPPDQAVLDAVTLNNLNKLDVENIGAGATGGTPLRTFRGDTYSTSSEDDVWVRGGCKKKKKVHYN